MSLFSYNLNKHGKGVTFEDRDERIINGASQEVFSNERTDKALMKTLKGVAVFDSTNTERVATHELCLAWRDDIGAEQWVRRTDGVKRLKILTAENVGECDKVLRLLCTERGDGAIEVNTA